MEGYPSGPQLGNPNHGHVAFFGGRTIVIDPEGVVRYAITRSSAAWTGSSARRKPSIGRLRNYWRKGKKGYERESARRLQDPAPGSIHTGGRMKRAQHAADTGHEPCRGNHTLQSNVIAPCR